MQNSIILLTVVLFCGLGIGFAVNNINEPGIGQEQFDQAMTGWHRAIDSHKDCIADLEKYMAQ